MKRVDVAVYMYSAEETGEHVVMKRILEDFKMGTPEYIMNSIISSDHSVMVGTGSGNSGMAMVSYVVVATVEGSEETVDPSTHYDIVRGLHSIWEQKPTGTDKFRSVDIVGEELVGEDALYVYNTIDIEE